LLEVKGYSKEIMAKKKQSKITSNNNKHVATKERIVTMQALQEQSDSDDDDENSPLPPESEWNAEAKALKARIEEGKFDQLVRKMENKKQNKKEEEEEEEEESSIEEVDLYDENSAEESRGNEEMAEQHANELESEDQNEEDSDLEEEDVAIDNEEQEQDEEEEEEEEEHVNEGNDSGEENENEVDNNDDSEEEEASGDDKNTQQANEDNENRSKALHIVTETLVAEKSKWPWAETFDVISETPLPFGTGENDINIHDDLKRELAFYDMALEAVMTAKKKCQEANIPFTRPDDFFAEMVKTDGTLRIDHVKHIQQKCTV
jgi:rRNA-processing protein EBP2